MNDEQKKIAREVQKQVPVAMTMPEPNKSRVLTCLAYEYFLLNMEEEAWKLIRQADPEYYKEGIHKDMAADASMEKIFMTIAAKLIESGYLSIDLKQQS